jgi:hypothetical protein
LAEYEDIFPVRTNIHGFLKENAKEVGMRTFPYNGVLRNTAAGITLFNATLAGLLL